MALFERLQELELRIDGLSLERLELPVSSGFTRVSTVVHLAGDGAEGHGEDVSYVAADHDRYRAVDLAGRWNVETFSRRLDELSLWSEPPEQAAAEHYRRWGLESAALDLALRQAGRSLADVLGREYRPVRFVVSTRLDPRRWLEIDPRLEFKLDPTSEWTRETMANYAATGRVRVLDLKAYYSGTAVDQAPDPDLYRAVVELFPDAVIEDPSLEGAARNALAGAEERLSFDAPVHSVSDLQALALTPRFLNVKPSRFGTLRALLGCVDHCEREGISLYGGGQFELGPGRLQIQRLASLLYADAPNDVAPGAYNAPEPASGLPSNPLPPPSGVGF